MSALLTLEKGTLLLLNVALVVEWPERISDFLPQPQLSITLEFGAEENERLVHLASRGGVVDLSGLEPA